MASVYLRFSPPDRDDIVKLHILESSTMNGALTTIEEVTDIGTFPNYINDYTTDQAGNNADWFAIQWEDSKGAFTNISERLQGGTKTVVLELIDRIMLRDPSIDEELARQEAEITLSEYFRTDDPYAIDPSTVTYAEWGGLTYLSLARIYISEILIGSNVSGYTAGIVAQQQGNTQKSLADVQRLIDEGNRLLGRNYSLVMQLEPVSFGTVTGAEIDQTRLLVELI